MHLFSVDDKDKRRAVRCTVIWHFIKSFFAPRLFPHFSFSHFFKPTALNEQTFLSNSDERSYFGVQRGVRWMVFWFNL